MNNSEDDKIKDRTFYCAYLTPQGLIIRTIEGSDRYLRIMSETRAYSLPRYVQ